MRITFETFRKRRKKIVRFWYNILNFIGDKSCSIQSLFVGCAEFYFFFLPLTIVEIRNHMIYAAFGRISV